MRPSQPLMARLRLTTKQVNGGYYKGTRSGSMGFFNQNGEYVVDYRKVRTYVVPKGLENFKLTPFVTKTFTPPEGVGITGKRYLELWKNRNISEFERMSKQLLKKRGKQRNENKLSDVEGDVEGDLQVHRSAENKDQNKLAHSLSSGNHDCHTSSADSQAGEEEREGEKKNPL